jgi:hypothetical protein
MYANVLRAGTLNDERFVRKVSSYFVPTHFNNNDPTRDPDSPAARAWKSIIRQKALQGQGLWVVAPDGTVLAGMSAEVDGKPSERAGNGPGAPWRANARFTEAALVLLDQTLERFGPVSERKKKAEPLPFRGAGVRPDGGVRLVVYNAGDNGLVFSVPLDAVQWAAFVPPRVAIGERWSLPESVAKAFAPVLSPLADTRFRPRPDNLETARLGAAIESVTATTATIRLTGRWAANWVHDDNERSIAGAAADGIAVFDREKNHLRSLLLIVDGSYSYTTGNRPDRRSYPNAAVVRWRRDGPAE